MLDKKLLQATDKAARRLKRNRSALVLQEQDRQGYAKHPATVSEWWNWEAEAAAWPEK